MSVRSEPVVPFKVSLYVGFFGGIDWVPGTQSCVRSEGLRRFRVEYWLGFLNTFRKLRYEQEDSGC